MKLDFPPTNFLFPKNLDMLEEKGEIPSELLIKNISKQTKLYF